MISIMISAMFLLILAEGGLFMEFEELLAAHVGCFLDQPDARDLPYRVESHNATVNGCRGACNAAYYRYAGVQAGRLCFCGSEYGRHGPGVCNVRCEGNEEQTCGGNTANAVFRTGFNVPGPPSDVQARTTTAATSPTNSLQFTWLPPTRANGGPILEYRVAVVLDMSYSPDKKSWTEKSLRISNTTTSATVIGLLAGSRYNVSVSAVSAEGEGPAASALLWTEVGTPKAPEPPRLVRAEEGETPRREGTIRVRLQPVEELEGPITAYQVVVIDATFPTPFNSETLYPHDRAIEEELTYWVAAELEPTRLKSEPEFVVGDNRFYGAYHNFGPLATAERDYHISLSAVSTLNNVTKRSFAKVSHEQHTIHQDSGMIVFKFDTGGNQDAAPHEHELHVHQPEPEGGEDERHRDAWGPSQDAGRSTKSTANDGGGSISSSAQTGLIAAVVVVSAALLIALLVFLFLRYSVHRRLSRHRLRRRLDTQELTASVASINTAAAENSSATYVAEDVEDDQPRTAADYLASLTSRVWQIPRNFLDINTEVVGRGRYGTVMRAMVNSQGQPVSCAAQIIPNRLLDDEDRLRMLRELDLNIRAGGASHLNLVGLVGLCEEQEATMVVFEAAELPLKQYLLDGRALATHPAYAEKTGRFATVREDLLLADILGGVCRGAAYLADQCGIHHGRMCARLIYLVGGGPQQPTVAKIGGFGLADVQRGNERVDATRWSSPEALLGKRTEAMLLSAMSSGGGGGKGAATSGGRADIWSFGCLLWEVATLGGTPYAGLRTRDVLGRVMRGGLRLPRTQYMSATLYQLMLSCWMSDPDERPDWQTVGEAINEMIADPEQGHLNYSLYSGFQYEPFQNELEILC